MRRVFDIRANQLDEKGHRHLLIAVPVLQTHPSDVERVVGERVSELTWRASFGDQVHLQGVITAEDPLIRLDFSPELPRGAWQIELLAQGARRERSFWKQQVYVQGAPRIPREQIRELASRFAPVFVFADEEEHFPVSLHHLFESESIRDAPDVLTFQTVFGKERVALPDLGEYLAFNGHSDYLIDFSFLGMRRSMYARLGSDPRDSVVYWSYAEDPDSRRFFISYHLFYAFDTKVGIARLTGVGPHVFDRESMILEFVEGEQAPRAMILSGHLENQMIFFLRKLKAWSQGRIRVNWTDAETLKLGTHPIIAVAEGSHALYPTSGVYRVSILSEFAGHLNSGALGDDGRRDAIRDEQLLCPPGLGLRELDPYDLIDLRIDEITSHPDPSRTPLEASHWLAFSGFWVDVPGWNNARFPPFTRKISEIVDWADGAYTWNWSDLPMGYRKNNRLILNYLSAQVHADDPSD